MEIKVRDVDTGAVNVLNDEARKQNVSRNELLKRHIEDLAQFNGIKRAEKELDSTISRVGDALEMTYNRIDQLEKQSMKMYLLLATVLDVDPEEVDDYLEKVFKINI
ncbi:hypothetical protein [Lentibacillus amyloliquefaciens]|uniref:Ribbon-helix-helix protein CopG domain-containing protein n=1 Tax=Lentibacillus amyloliquefaciens TaxID=1472767 RepID=A0A0U4FP84_9BACI|nr:hypothetical protein [Lentibacillus amyloliquefaciens]ALX47653.1 hypothetical protein AOX59_02970 [Lentibacillus amyloliquefaciens]